MTTAIDHTDRVDADMLAQYAQQHIPESRTDICPVCSRISCCGYIATGEQKRIRDTGEVITLVKIKARVYGHFEEWECLSEAGETRIIDVREMLDMSHGQNSQIPENIPLQTKEKTEPVLPVRPSHSHDARGVIEYQSISGLVQVKVEIIKQFKNKAKVLWCQDAMSHKAGEVSVIPLSMLKTA